MPSLLFVIAPEQFRDEELLTPVELCRNANVSTTIASTQTGLATGMLGYEQDVSLSIAELNHTTFEGIVIVGGYGSVSHLWDNSSLHQLVQEFHSANKLVSAICVSPVVLAKAGVLAGKQATVWSMPESLEAFKKADTVYVADDVVIDGTVITANGPEASQAFAEAILHQLSVTVAS